MVETPPNPSSSMKVFGYSAVLAWVMIAASSQAWGMTQVPRIHGWVTDPISVLDADDQQFRDELWAQRLRAGDKLGAVRAFIQKLRSAPPRLEREWQYTYLNRWQGEMVGMTGGHHLDPDMVVDLHIIGAYGTEHQYEGEIDWLKRPSEMRGNEYVAQLNRHYQWGTLADAYARTGEPKYARAWEKELRSWMAQCPPPPGGKERRPAWSNPGLYSGIRLGWTWPHAFEVFRTSEHVSDEALWLMVCGFRTQGVRLLHHPQTRHHNRRLLETIGLATVEVLLPELRFAEALGVAGREKAIAAAEYQFYPDGHHLELAPNYTAMCLANLYAVAGRHRADGGEWPHRYLDRLATIGNALCRIAAPDGWTPALHDSQRNDCREMYQSLTAFLGEARMGEPAWRSGENDLLPWGGYGVLRRDGLYALLDGGAGQFDGHSHHDTMQVITFAHGRWFTIDPGKPRYGGGDMMRHLRSSRAHNVVTIDGRNRRPITPIIDEPVPLALVSKGPISVTATARRFTTDVREDRGGDGGPTVRFDHERVLINLADLGWLVFDRLTPLDQEPHAWRWAWHFPTDRVELSGDDSALAVYDGGPTMRVQTVASRSLKRRVCEGQTEPQLCGWRSEGESNRPVPAPALVALAPEQPGPCWAVTLLAPSPGEDGPAIAIQDVRSEGGERWVIRLVTPQGPHRITFQGAPRLTNVTYRDPLGHATGLEIP